MDKKKLAIICAIVVVVLFAVLVWPIGLVMPKDGEKKAENTVAATDTLTGTDNGGDNTTTDNGGDNTPATNNGGDNT